MAIQVWNYSTEPDITDASTTNIQIVEGSPFSTSESFVDDNQIPLIPQAGFPIAQLWDDKDLVVQTTGYIKTQQSDGRWFADLTVPPGIEFVSGKEKVLKLTWVFKDQTGSTEKSSLLVTIISNTEEAVDDYRELVVLGPVTKLSVTVPYIVNTLAGDSANFSLYNENALLLSIPATAAKINGPNSILELQLNGVQGFNPRLRPYNLVIDIQLSATSRQLYTQLYQINPSILSAMNSLEMAINKANQIETIKGLQYREVDLLQALTRGLDYFNNVPPSLTSFTGIDMRGSIREGWLICASIRALRAQLQAEGLFNFDFSGQNISLNVDRTQAIDTACSAYEAMVDSLVRPMKTLLAKKGVIGGDGSVGDRLATMSQMGVLTISNTAITRSRVGNALLPTGWMQ